MALALVRALKLAGHEVEIASDLRSFSKSPHGVSHLQAAVAEAGKIIERWEDSPPDLWFSYHPYYKAPDLIGLEILKTCRLPVVTAECSIAPRRNEDDWQASQQYVRALLQQSSANFYFTDRDVDGLLREVSPTKITHLAPFIDLSGVARVQAPSNDGDGPVQLVTMGMMREGVKLQSYAMLAKSLAKMPDSNWRLTIIGDGKMRGEVEALFGQFASQKLNWCGEVAPHEVPPILARGEIFVWPGFGEAYGLAYMEAQAVGLPVVAQKTHGVPFVVADRHSGILVDVDDINAYSAAIAELMADKTRRRQYGCNARELIMEKHGLEAASRTLSTTLQQVAG